MYCSPDSTWATIEDLYQRFGDEYVDKLAIRRVWDSTLEQYVADESPEGKEMVLELALCDAKQYLKQKIGCCYGSVELLDQYVFLSIKSWHIKLTIETLKVGGDCYSCTECNKSFDDFCGCNSICSQDGVCLPSKKTFIEVSESCFPCEKKECEC